MSEGILLDTCIVVDHLLGRLDEKIRTQIDMQPRRYASAANAWEFELKPELRDVISQSELAKAFLSMGVRVLPITLNHISALSKLPKFDGHKDPFDRMLIAQALVHKLMVATYNRKFEWYGVKLLIDGLF